MTIRAYKQRIYPNAEQRLLLARHFGAGRWAFNFGLEVIFKSYSRRKDKINWVGVSKGITRLKKTRRYHWLNDVSSDVISQKLRDLDRAYQNFFAGRAKYPRFRKKRSNASVRFVFDSRHSGKIKAWANGEMILPKIGKIQLREHLPKALPKMITVRIDAAGRYFASFSVEQEIAPKPKTGKAVGIDMGIHSLATITNGPPIENPNYLGVLLRRLRQRQKNLSRKTKGSARWKRQALRVAKVHAKIADSRRDFLHKATTDLVENQDVICVESLNVKGMVKNPKLSRSLHDASMSEFLSMLKYKCEWYGKEFIEIDPWFPSSKLCSYCGHKLDELNLSVRRWTCPKCKLEHERDFNASRNILAEGLRVRVGSPDFKRVENQALAFDRLNKSETRLNEARIVFDFEPTDGTEVRDP